MIKNREYYTEKAARVTAMAATLLELEPTWTELHQAIYGADGAASIFTVSELNQFKQTEQHAAIMQEIKRLQSRKAAERVKTRVTTIRMPEAVYRDIKKAAKESDMSLNKWCVQVMIQATS